MKQNLFLFFIIAAALSMTSCDKKREGKPRVLVFSKTAGYRHESIEDGKLALIELGKKNDFETDTTEDAGLFTEENLKKYGNAA